MILLTHALVKRTRIVLQCSTFGLKIRQLEGREWFWGQATSLGNSTLGVSVLPGQKATWGKNLSQGRDVGWVNIPDPHSPNVFWMLVQCYIKQNFCDFCGCCSLLARNNINKGGSVFLLNSENYFKKVISEYFSYTVLGSASLQWGPTVIMHLVRQDPMKSAYSVLHTEWM